MIALVLLSLLAAGMGNPAGAQPSGLCGRLEIPEDLGLACRELPGAKPLAVVEPSGGEFAALSRMTVRELVREGDDALAWGDPEAWLKTQVAIDPSGLAGALRGLATSPDSPFAGEGAEGAAEAFAALLGRLSRLPLSACEGAAQVRTGVRELRCRYAASGVGVFRVERVVAEAERRFAIAYRTLNEQRLRHFEALANSFAR